MNIIRQGDVLLREILTIPKGCKRKDKILAYGEITGHKHQFISGKVTVFKDEEENQFCDVKTQSVLGHEDHAHLEIPKGKYEVILQREYDPLEGIRQVMD